MTRLKNRHFYKTKTCDKTETVKNSNSDTSQIVTKIKLWQNSNSAKTQIFK